MKYTSKLIYHHLANAQNIIIVPHQKPDGDALGSATALFGFLHNLNKSVIIYSATTFPANLNNLPHTDKITTDPLVWKEGHHDTVIVVDCGDLRHAGIEKNLKELDYQPIIITFDHHATNEKFGQHNLVHTSASSTAEVIYKFFKHNEIEIDQKMSFSLLTGILSDTDNFVNSATSVHSLKIAGELIRYGGSLDLVRNIMFKDKTVNSLKIWGLALSRLTKHEQFDIVYTHITQQDLKTHAVKDSETDGIANFLNNLNEGKASLLLKEQADGKISASFRTTRDDFDVAEIAKSLGR